MGLGTLGRGVGDAEYLAKCGAELLITDLKRREELAPSLSRLERFSTIRYTLGEHRNEDFVNRDLILQGAAVSPASPYLEEARRSGVPVRMSGDLFAELSNARIVGVTGTRGKTTTALLIHHILKTAGVPSILGGNIVGVSNLALLSLASEKHTAVLELDSWQLHGFGRESISPSVSVFTTFYPDHLHSYNNSIVRYLADKAQIFLHQESKDTLILSENVAPLIQEKYPIHAARSHTAFSGTVSTWERRIIGNHNLLNIACAVQAATALGISESTIKEAVRTFAGVPGRLELVREWKDIRFYNDTTAIIQEATIAALEALKERPIILILGGRDKKLPIDALIETIHRHTKHVVLLPGSGSERIHPHLHSASLSSSLDDAIETAINHAMPGDTVLLSPAFSSLGFYDSVFERGDIFRSIVQAL